MLYDGTTPPEIDLFIKTIKKDVVDSGLFEAFLESTPQFILQCSIILRTGIISKLAEEAKSFSSVQL